MEVSAAQLRGAYPDATPAAAEAHLNVRSDDGINGIRKIRVQWQIGVSVRSQSREESTSLSNLGDIVGRDAWCMISLD
jgi:hypothetical protein